MPPCADVMATFEVDDELPVHSQVLRIASPVFDAMFEADMKERSDMRFRVDIASKDEFRDFYNCLLPGGQSSAMLSEQNVDSMLALSDYYQVQFMRDVCTDFLSELPVSPSRLLQARKHGLMQLYERCVDAIAEDVNQHDLAELTNNGDILLDVISRMQKKQEISNDTQLRNVLLGARSYVGDLRIGSMVFGTTPAPTVYKALSDIVT